MAKKHLRFGLLLRIAVGFFLVTALQVTITAVSSINTQSVGNQFKVLSTQTTPFARNSQILANEFLQFETKVRAIVSSLSSNQLEQLNEQAKLATAIINDNISHLKSQTNDQKQLELLNNIENEFILLTNKFNEITKSKQLYFFSENEINKLSEKLAKFQKDFTPLLENVLFSLDDIDDRTKSILYETQTTIISGMWYVEQIKALTDYDSIEKISGSEFFIWLGDVTALAVALKGANDSPEISQVVAQIISLASQLTDDVRGTATPSQKANGVVSGLGAYRLQFLEINQQLNKVIGEFGDQVTSINSNINQLVTLSNEQSQLIETQVEEKIASSLQLVFILSALAVVISILISTFTTLSFKRGFHKIKNTLAKYSEGDLSLQFKKHANDEMGDLERYSKKMADSLRQLIADINRTFDQVNNSVQESQSLAIQTSEHVREQKLELESVTDSVEKMSTTSDQVLQFVQTTYEKVESADKLANQGSSKVQENHKAIESVNTQFQDSLNSILQLDKGVNQIEEILQTIGSIAEQTNLLALNAAIEAARAGEQGRGFAVVADEVRSLANRTQQSTAEIQSMTAQMLSDSKKAVSMVTDSGSRIEKSLNLAKEADATISQFATVMDDIRNLSNMITTQTEEQSSTTQIVSKNVVQISQLASKTENIASKTNNSGNQLSELSKELIGKIGQFKL